MQFRREAGMNFFSMFMFAAIVVAAAFVMTKNFLFVLTEAFPTLVKARKLLNLLYIVNFAILALFKERTFLNNKVDEDFTLAVYLYFTFMFIFFCYGIFTEILVRLRRLFRKVYEKKMSVGRRRIVFILLFMISFHTVASGWILADRIVVKHIELHDPRIGEYTKIVQISDTHFSRITGWDFAAKIVPMINGLDPDIVIFSGDFADKGVISPDKVAGKMKKIKAPLGKYAVSGNHEMISGYSDARRFIEQSGFEFIDGMVIDTGRNIVIGGVMDKSAEKYGVYYHKDSEVLSQFDPKNFNIYVKHRPELEPGDDAHFDLMLSGHTHGGQIFPFTFAVMIANSYVAGLYDLENGAKLYVSRGTGAWGPSVRFAATPEITLIELRP